MQSRMVDEGEILEISIVGSLSNIFDKCLLVVTESCNWGVKGYVRVVGTEMIPGGPAYLRVEWADLKETGGSIKLMNEGENS